MKVKYIKFLQGARPIEKVADQFKIISLPYEKKAVKEAALDLLILTNERIWGKLTFRLKLCYSPLREDLASRKEPFGRFYSAKRLQNLIGAEIYMSAVISVRLSESRRNSWLQRGKDRAFRPVPGSASNLPK